MEEKSPYKFLDFYGIEDQSIFFGREREANILVADIIVNRLVVLFARTGTGKTSLMNAGVRPQLEDRNFSTFYIRVEQDPTKAARDTLRDFLSGELQKSQIKNEPDAKTLLGQLESSADPFALSAQLCSLVKVLGEPIVLFFDQFEEFFLHILDRTTRQKFIKDISEVYRDANSGVHLVFSMREEYFHQMDEFREDIPSIFHKNSNLRLMPLDEEQARDAIIKPAAALNVTFDVELANEIIEDLKNDRDGIRAPSLQIICDTLWKKEDNTDRHLTLDDYHDLGGAQRILEQRLAEDIEEALEKYPKLLPTVKKMIPELKTERGTKIPRLVSELAQKLKVSRHILEESIIAPLKGKQIIKGITLAKEDAIEWASDYLSERTELIEDIVDSIELIPLFDTAWKRINEEAELPILQENEFVLLSENKTTIGKFTKSENLVLFDTALFHQTYMELWFEMASGSTTLDYQLLENKIQNADSETGEREREGILKLLLDLGTDQALHVLELAVHKPEISKKSIATLIIFPGEGAFQFLRKLLEEDEFWETVVYSLGQAGGERAIQLLGPLLSVDTKFLQALRALDSLAKSKSEIRYEAINLLESAIPILDTYITKQELFYKALDALDGLTKSSAQIKEEAENRSKLLENKGEDSKTEDSQAEISLLNDLIQQSDRIRIGSEKALEAGLQEPIALPLEEKELLQAILVLERLTQYTDDSIQNYAEKILESVIPSLETGLEIESTRGSAKSGLERIAKINGRAGELAHAVLKSASVTPTPIEVSGTVESGNRIRSVSLHREKNVAIKGDVVSGTSSQRFQTAREKLESTSQDSPSRIADLIPFIRTGTVIPIISNSLRINQIFRDEQSLTNLISEAPEFVDEDLTIDEQLTREWATSISYPMADDHNLARVAQYYQTEQKESLLAKTKYLKFLTNYLLDINMDEDGYQQVVQELRTREAGFSDIVKELNFPRFPSGMEDPLRLLARLPLSTYITTSYYHFLESALQAEGKKPRTLVCFWSGGKRSAPPEHALDPLYKPTDTEPLVYHLFGLEDYPQTLVLSEDDYLEFLTSVVDADTMNPVVPLRVRDGLAKSRLLFLGYEIRDPGFQVLFSLLSYWREKFAPRGVVTQLFSEKQIENLSKWKTNTTQYFNNRQFDIEHTRPESFILKLWDEWNKSR